MTQPKKKKLMEEKIFEGFFYVYYSPKVVDKLYLLLLIFNVYCNFF